MEVHCARLKALCRTCRQKIEDHKRVGCTARITRYGFSGAGSQEWISVTMDGLPFLIAVSIIEKIVICLACTYCFED